MNILTKFFSPISLLVSIISLAYVYYKAEIYWGGSPNDIYSVYYSISFFLIFFSFVSFFLKNNIKEYLVILILTILVFLYGFEGYLNLNKEIPKWQVEKKIKYEKKTGDKYDTRTILEIFEDLKKEDAEVKISLAPLINFYPNNEIFPLSNISNSKTILCNENGYYSVYTSDRYGFNNPDQEWNSDEIEYLLVGDSFTHGACVNRPEDIGSVLRILSGKSVLNLGYSANGPLIEYATLKEYLLPKVKKVLWVYYEGNDFKDLKNELKNKILKNYLTDNNFKQNLILKQSEIDKLVDSKIKISVDPNHKIKKYILLSKTRSLLIKNFNSKIKKNLKDQKKKVPESFTNILKLAKDFVENNNSELYFIFLPRMSSKEIYNNKTYDDELYILVKQIVTELKIPFIDIKKEIYDLDGNVLRLLPLETLGGHYNAKGYKKIAELIHKLSK